MVAHSMGNRGLVRALQRIAANAETRGHVKFGQVFLAAPGRRQRMTPAVAGDASFWKLER